MGTKLYNIKLDLQDNCDDVNIIIIIIIKECIQSMRFFTSVVLLFMADDVASLLLHITLLSLITQFIKVTPATPIYITCLCLLILKNKQTLYKQEF